MAAKRVRNNLSHINLSHVNAQKLQKLIKIAICGSPFSRNCQNMHTFYMPAIDSKNDPKIPKHILPILSLLDSVILYKWPKKWIKSIWHVLIIFVE